jgi:N-acetylneuraminate synthase
MSVRIGPFDLGEGHPPLVVPEVGINHNGSIDLALGLVEAAHAAGARCVKFQCHIVQHEMIRTDMKPGKISDETLWDIIERCSLSEAEERQIQRACETRGMLYLSTPFSREAADRLNEMGVPAFKIGSGEVTNLPLLDHIARFGKPILLSSGMTRLAELDRSVALLRSHDIPLVLLHCVSMYPTPYEQLHLRAIVRLRERYGVPVGLSDHSANVHTAIAAVALGAVVLEKHFTLDRSLPGADQKMSIEPAELGRLVQGAAAVHAAMKEDEDVILPEEMPVMEFARESVVAIRPIPAGEVLSLANLWVKRPGTGGIPAHELPRVLGRRAVRDLAYDHQLAESDLA